MNECTSCQKELSDYRYHLGYTECVDCSKEEKYSAHQVYPHKTGGFVQPVKHETKKHLQKIDRRSTGGRTAKGIFSDQSWDRWLDKYYDNLNNPKPKRKVVWKSPKIVYISMSEAESMVKKYYDDWGYQPTLDYCKELYLDDKISMVMKNQLTNMVTDQQMLPKRLRKWVQRIK